jgi:hypothetical protein
VPSSKDPEARTDGTVRSGGAQCGRERWAVKVAADPAAARINTVPRDTTIAQLDAFPSTNPDNPDQPRDSGVESQVWRLTANLDAVKQEADSDFHLALSDGQGHTMIAEIPNAPACTEPPITGVVSVLEPQIEQARNAFIQEFGVPSSQSFTPINHQVTLTGVGFFDVLHGQRNVAPNGVELHPVLSIQDP